MIGMVGQLKSFLVNREVTVACEICSNDVDV